MSAAEERSSDEPTSSDTFEILYEVHRHATGGGPPVDLSQQVDGGPKLASLSVAFSKGMRLLKETWVGNKRTRSLKRSLFISLNGEHIAVASGSQITILRKEDNYMSPCGLFTSIDNSTFVHGAWLEPQGILGLVDNLGSLYVVKSHGEEISRTTSRQMKISFPVVGMFSLGDPTAEQLCLFGFCIVTVDGSFHYTIADQKQSSYVTAIFNPNSQLKLNGRSPLRVACLDFYPTESLVAVVCNAVGPSGNLVNESGFYSLYLWHLAKNFIFELLFCSPAFEGIFFVPKGSPNSFASAKVSISPQCKYVAVLDMNGFLDIYAISSKPYSLSFISFNAGHLETEERKCLKNVVDFSWWSDHVIVLSMRDHAVRMVDVQNEQRILRNDPALHSSVLSGVAAHEGHIFALENMQSMGNTHSLVHEEIADVPFANSVQENLHLNSYLYWSLTSLTGRSVTEMYEMYIQRKEYQEALIFARRHHLDSDQVYKSQWLCSEQGIHDITNVLQKIKDHEFVLSECIEKVGRTEDAAMALLMHGLYITESYKFSGSDDDENNSIWKHRIARLQLLQCRDRLDTFLGINMGRFSSKEYGKFRILPLNESAISLAESGKIGALNLLYKRHPYSLASHILHILGAIPETIPVQTYGQLLPGRCLPVAVTLRDDDWVECGKMIPFTGDASRMSEFPVDSRTENLLKLSMGFVWPSVPELSDWYKHRAEEIDNLTGQLENCLCLIDLAFNKGIVDLSPFLKDVRYLHELTYSDGESDFMLSIVSWEQLTDYEKFKMMLKGVVGDKLIGRLLEKAIPFMYERAPLRTSELDSMTGNQLPAVSRYDDSFLVAWLKEIAAENKLDICSSVIKEGCDGMYVNGIFKDEAEAMETAIECLYSCSLTDSWNTMASIISNLPQKSIKDKSFGSVDDISSRHNIQCFGFPRPHNESGNLGMVIMGIGNGCATQESTDAVKHDRKVCLCEELNKRVKITSGHIEVGRLLAYYQVPKPMNFFLVAHLDEKNVKQLIRLVLSKFSRQQGRVDAEWAKLWSDMQCLQEKAFSFLDKEYVLTEFCRGLLKAGKFSLARNYLSTLASEKAENLVIQAAREYFFSASSLSCSEIWKAKECLNLFPDSENVKAECDIIDALTKKLPNLGVTLLPMQFRQIGNPMEIISMVIANQTKVYLDVDELIEVAKLLGLKSQDDIASIQEAVAREAAVSGDMLLAYELCVSLARKGHGPIWDLASAIARGPTLDNMDTDSRKHLLGFALSYCDDDSIGDLLHAWKEVNMKNHNEKLVEPLTEDSSIMEHRPQVVGSMDRLNTAVDNVLYWDDNDEIDHAEHFKSMLDIIVKDWPTKDESGLDYFLKETGNASFVSRSLPWLFKLCMEEEDSKEICYIASENKYPSSLRGKAGLCILSWVASNSLVPGDGLIASVAKHMMEVPASCGEVISRMILLNLRETFHGVGWIEEQLKTRGDLQDVYPIMNLGMMYSSLQSMAIGCSTPSQRLKLLSRTFKEKNWSSGTDEAFKLDGVETQFWREWSSKLEEQKMLAEQARELEKIIPGVESARFLSGDIGYIEDVILTFMDSVKLERRHILKQAMKLADTYGLKRSKVLIRYLRCTLVSTLWTEEEILSEISDFKNDVVASAAEIISMICLSVYPEIDGINKQRISHIYSILSACSSYLKRIQDSSFGPMLELNQVHKLELPHFYKILEQECKKISFITDLNFKNVANLHDLSFEHFNEEVYRHVSASTIDALADMVQVLVGIYDNPQAIGLISRITVYRHHILSMLADVNAERKAKHHPITAGNFTNFMKSILNCYNNCKAYIGALPEEEIPYILGKFCLLCFPDDSMDLLEENLNKDTVLETLNFWIEIAADFPITTADYVSRGMCFTSAPSEYLVVFKDLIMEDGVSAIKGWSTLSSYLKFSNYLTADISLFCKSMVLSGCSFKGILDIFSKGVSVTSSCPPNIEDLVELYTNIMDVCLNEVANESGNQQNLYKLLSSVSKLMHDRTEDLNSVRHRIWEKLTELSGDMQLSSHFRVYLLELMQSILGRKVQSFSDKLFADVAPWEGWDDPVMQYGTPENMDVPCRLTNNLVALKSNQLLATISSDLNVSPEDLSTLDSATSCFLFLLTSAASQEHIKTLQAILFEWEELFINQIDDKKKSPEFMEESNNWSGEEWGEGWDDDDEPAKEVKHDSSSVHPLHVCWVGTIRKLIDLKQARVVPEYMDQLLEKSQLILLERNEAQDIQELLLGIDPMVNLKFMLLLPYEDLTFQSLSELEDKLKQGGLQNSTDEEPVLLMLLLSSGLLPSIANDPSYSKLFSYLCHLVGCLARQSQEDLLRQGQSRSHKIAYPPVLFCRLLLPCFVSELVISGQYLLAGHIISRWMHTHVAFSLLNVAEVSLRKYLEGLIGTHQRNELEEERLASHGAHAHTCTKLSRKLGSLVHTALSVLQSIS